MCKFQALRTVTKELNKLGCKYINHTLNDGEMKIKYIHYYGSEEEMIIKYRYFTNERLIAKIIMEVMM